MLVDIFIVTVAYALALFAAVLAYCNVPRLKRRLRPSPVKELEVLLPKIKLLLKYGGDGARLIITQVTEKKFRQVDALKVTKYISSAGDFGLECFIPTRIGGRNFAPGGNQYTGSDWPMLARFLSEHGIEMTEVRSPLDTHWSDSYHLLRLDFGRDCQMALSFAAFYFGKVFELPTRHFNYEVEDVHLLNRLLRRTISSLSKQQLEAAQAKGSGWTPWNQSRHEPRAEYRDVYFVIVRMLAIAGILYGLMFAGDHWPAMNLSVSDRELSIPAFDLAFFAIFAASVFGEHVLRRAANSLLMRLLAYAIFLVVQGVHQVTRFAVKVDFLVARGSLRELFAPEEPKLYGMLMYSHLPGQHIVRTIGAGVTALGLLLCAIAIYFWH